ncbi:MAG: RecX family transcriptional regulator [Alphaproteobacteria bacterium]|nr:RecX family transcriptional regulator [Alphaproteobacteria bacterium]
MGRTENKAELRTVNSKSKRSPSSAPRLPKKITETYLHNSGLYYLQRFAASKKHFKSVMARKVRRSCQAHPEQDLASCLKMVDDLADKFEAAGLLNDAVYVRGILASLLRQGRSLKAIRAKLLIKGLSEAQISESLAQYHEEEGLSLAETDLQSALRFARRKKIGPFRRGPKEPSILQKELGVFARAGFSYDLSKTVVEMDSDDPRGVY